MSIHNHRSCAITLQSLGYDGGIMTITSTYISHASIATRRQLVRKFLMFYSNHGNEMGVYYIMAWCITQIVSEIELQGFLLCLFFGGGGGRGNASSRLIDRPKVQVRSVDRLMASECFT